MKDPASRPANAWGFPMMGLLLIPLGLTLYAWFGVSGFIEERSAAQFKALTQESEKALLHRVESYEQALSGGAGLFRSSEHVTPAEWRTYIQAIDVRRRYPGINGMGWIAPVPGSELNAFVERVRSESMPDFKLHHLGSGSEYFITTYLEPEADNREGIGRNIASEEHRYHAATLARDTGRPTVTRRVLLLQDRERGAGFLLLLPMYRAQMPLTNVEERRAAFRGWIFAPFMSRHFLTALTNSQGETMHLKVYDGDASAQNLIYDSNPHHPAGQFNVQRKVRIGQEHWVLVWSSTPAFEQQSTSFEPLLILACGLLLTGLFAAFLITVARRTQTAQLLAQEKTRQLYESEQRYQMIIDGVEDYAIYMLDPQGKVKSWNSGAQRLLQYGAEEILGRHFCVVHTEEDQTNQVPQGTLMVAEECGAYMAEAWHIRKDGSRFWAGITVNALRDSQGALVGFVEVVQDLTERKEAERLKREFISTVSHELRTPLTSIRGSLGLMAAGALGPLPEKMQSLVGIALSNSERLVLIINDILDMEKMESGRLQLQIARVPLASFLERALRANQAYGEKYGVSFALEPMAPGLEIQADPDRLMQVMSNLMSNAAKFSPQRSQVLLRARKDGANVRIEVQDFGTGIPEEFRGRIFEKFAQADSSTARRFEGTGLGLSITKRLVEAMNGSIGFISVVGQGTTFRVQLPIASEVSRGIANIADGNVPRILHVEDDIDLVQVIATALQGQAQVIAAHSLQVARELLERERFALAVIDTTLPDGSGLDLLDTLEKGEFPTPVIVLSAGEVLPQVRQRVSAALVKARVPETRIVQLILALIRPPLSPSPLPSSPQLAQALES